jgi:hypothetical protein
MWCPGGAHMNNHEGRMDEESEKREIYKCAKIEKYTKSNFQFYMLWGRGISLCFAPIDIESSMLHYSN